MSEAAPTQWPDKNPTDVLDYAADFDEFLEAAELITTKVVTPPAGITLDSDAIDSTSKKIVLFLSGGVDGDTYEFEVEVTTDNVTPRTIKRRWTIRVVEVL